MSFPFRILACIFAALAIAEVSVAQTTAHSDHSMPGMSGASMPIKENMGMPMAFGPIPDSQEASGTAWQPSDTPMYAMHSMHGDWTLMTHYNAFVGYDHQSGSRGGDQFNSVNWLMLMATKRESENELTLRSMFSLEPATTTREGYPLLFQSGEAFRGQPLIDRQHPHDLFMELSARYRRMFNPDSVFSLYVAPSGEPALGPPAFPHRMSAMDNPAALISHHWLDSTHISFGVLTAGLAQRTWQLEGSWFNGREPNDDRWDIERPKLDSYSGRFSWNPTPEWSAQISHGYLKSPEELHPDESVRRTTASLIYFTKLPGDRHLATAFAWGRNRSDQATNAFLIEPSYMANSYTVFARAEYVQKTGEELGLLPDDRRIPVRQFTVGVSRELVKDRAYQLALGASATYSWMPSDLDTFYGKHPVGYWIFLRLRAASMDH